MQDISQVETKESQIAETVALFRELSADERETILDHLQARIRGEVSLEGALDAARREIERNRAS